LAELEPLQQAMDKIESNYGTLASSSYNTTHSMPLENVKLDADKMIASLKTSEMLFNNTNTLVAPNIEQVCCRMLSNLDVNGMLIKPHPLLCINHR
jgi:hypothetical protein